MTKKKPSYWELLRDPRWQKMRLEIMQRDSFACKQCGDEKSTLNVHHTYYERDKMPWDYPPWSLHTLCEPCHETAEEDLATLRRAIGLLSLRQIEELTGYAYALSLSDRSENDAPPIVEVTCYDEIVGLVSGLLAHNGKYSRPISDAAYEFSKEIAKRAATGDEFAGTVGFLDVMEFCFPPPVDTSNYVGIEIEVAQ